MKILGICPLICCECCLMQIVGESLRGEASRIGMIVGIHLNPSSDEFMNSWIPKSINSK